MNDRTKLLSEIQKYDFALTDTNLYLNSHPKDTDALEYFRKTQSCANEVTRCYEREFGPLTVYSAADKERWTWTDSPWPWQIGEVNK